MIWPFNKLRNKLKIKPIFVFEAEWQVTPKVYVDKVYYMNIYKTGKGFDCITGKMTTLERCQKSSKDFLRGTLRVVIDAETGKLKDAEVL